MRRSRVPNDRRPQASTFQGLRTPPPRVLTHRDLDLLTPPPPPHTLPLTRAYIGTPPPPLPYSHGTVNVKNYQNQRCRQCIQTDHCTAGIIMEFLIIDASLISTAIRFNSRSRTGANFAQEKNGANCLLNTVSTVYHMPLRGYAHAVTVYTVYSPLSTRRYSRPPEPGVLLKEWQW